MVELTFKGGPTDYYQTWREAESAAWGLLPKYAAESATIREGARQKTILYSDAIAAMDVGYHFDGKIAPAQSSRRSRASVSKSQ